MGEGAFANKRKRTAAIVKKQRTFTEARESIAIGIQSRQDLSSIASKFE